MNKINPTDVVIYISAILLTIFFILLVNRKRDNQSPLQIEIEKLQKKIDKQDRMIHDALIDIKMMRDTVYYYESKKPIITNNYFKNEKVTLTSNDSINAIIRESNQREFERRYFKGRYTPTK
jgi:hypothetical protein